MTIEEDRHVITPEGNIIDLDGIPESLLPIVAGVYENTDAKASLTTYGHAAFALAHSIRGGAQLGHSEEEIRQNLIGSVREKVTKHGPKLIQFLIESGNFDPILDFLQTLQAQYERGEDFASFFDF